MPLPRGGGKRGFMRIMHELAGPKAKKRPLAQRLAIAFAQSGYNPKRKRAGSRRAGKIHN